MPAPNLERPRFLDSFIGAIAKSAEKRSWRAVVPIWPLVAACFGAVFAYLIPAQFWSQEKLEAAVAVYIGIVTLNGLILALSWSAFSRIHESIIDSPFCSYLMNKGILNDYILYIDFVHVSQLSSIIISGGALLVLLCQPGNITFDRIAFGAMIFISSYAIKQAAAAVTIMHDLIWQKAIFDDHMQSRRRDSAIEVRKEDARTTL
jgi:hypothetical protein